MWAICGKICKALKTLELRAKKKPGYESFLQKLITRRLQVQVLSPQPEKTPYFAGNTVFFYRFTVF